MRILYDPISALAFVSAATSLVGGFVGAGEETDAAEAEVQDIEAQRRTERIQADRDIRDENAEARRLLRRNRAALAARGATLEDVQLFEEETRGESLLRINRRRSDRQRLDRSLERQAQGARRRGRSRATGSVISGVGQAGSSLLRSGAF